MLRLFTLALILGVFSTLQLFAADAPEALDVWPAVAPGVPENPPAEKWDKNEPGKAPFIKVTNVSKPTIQFYPAPKEKNTGATLIICPGGGYKMLMMDYEGADAATWLNGLGVNAVVLKYRVPAPEGTPKHLPALQDAQRALSMVRSNAKKWDLDPYRIGIMGFSAGGHLSAAASTNFDKRAYEAKDEIDQVSCRPDFAVLIYPGGMVDKEKGGLTPEITVTEKTPPAFLIMSHEDRVNSENCILYYMALKKAGISSEMHIYANGQHGYGMRPGEKSYNKWIDRCAEWLNERGYLKAAETK
jgi:acetyl esterase/lipase